MMLLVMILGIAGLASAQAITGYRYWFDADIGTAKSMSVTASANLKLDASLSAKSLEKGYHTITLQFKDENGIYSSPVTKRFILNSQLISGYRYWFDGDISTATSVSVTASASLKLDASLSTNSLTNGYHTISLQLMDENGSYSAPVTKRFISSGSNIAAYDYWWDGSYASHTMVNVTPVQTFDLATAITPYNLEAGPHLFAIRFEDMQGNWSVPVQDTVRTTVFISGIMEISSVSNITIFPNPTHLSAKLVFDGTGKEILTMTITDLTGKQIKQQELQNGFGHEQFLINTSDMTAGIYFVKVTSGKGSATRKLIVQ